MPSSALSVRPIRSHERARLDETLAAQHWLGTGPSARMRYLAEEDGSWIALVGFGSAAPCVLDQHRRQNLASQVLAMTLRRLSFGVRRACSRSVSSQESCPKKRSASSTPGSRQ